MEKYVLCPVKRVVAISMSASLSGDGEEENKDSSHRRPSSSSCEGSY